MRENWPSLLLTSKIPTYLLFALLYLSLLHLLHLHSSFFHKYNDIMNDAVFAKDKGEEIFPVNVLIIDVEPWPYFKDNRKAAKTTRNEVVKSMINIIAQCKPTGFTGIDMSFESYADPDIMERLTELVKNNHNIFLSVEFDQQKKGIKWLKNFFWDEIKKIRNIQHRLMVVNLEKYRQEPVRRYKRYYKDKYGNSLPSLGAVVAGRIEEDFDNKKAARNNTARFTYSYVLEEGTKEYNKYRIYSLSEAQQWLEKTMGEKIGKIDMDDAIILFGRMDPDPKGRDRFEIYAGRESHRGIKRISQPGLMIHLNAAQSMAFEENIIPLSASLTFLFLIFLFVLLIMFYSIVTRLFSNFNFNIYRLYGVVFFLVSVIVAFLILFFGGRYAAAHSIEMPLFTFTAFTLLFLPGIILSGWIYRDGVLRVVFLPRYRDFMKVFRRSLLECVTQSSPLLRMNMMLDLFQTIVMYLAFYELSRWRQALNHGEPGIAKKARKKIKGIKDKIWRPTIGKFRGLTRELNVSGKDLFRTLDSTGSLENAFDRLLAARNEFRHQASAYLSRNGWEKECSKLVPAFLLFLEHLKPELSKKITGKEKNTEEKELVLDETGENLRLFPLFREFECDFHRKREIFVYASGLSPGEEVIAMTGYTPLCKPLIPGETLNRSFKILKEELKYGPVK